MNMTRGDRLNAILHADVGGMVSKLVLFVLDNYTGTVEEKGCWPSQETIARDANCTERAVRKALAELVRLKCLKRTPQYNTDGRTSDKYHIDYEMLARRCPEKQPIQYRNLVPALGSVPEPGSGSVAERGSGEPLIPEPLIKTPIVPKDRQASVPTPGPSSGFDKFWKKWPPGGRKVDPRGCRRIWDRENLEPLTDRILKSIDQWRISIDWCKDDGQFIPMPATWLNQRRWEADPEPAPEGQQPFIERRFTIEDAHRLLGTPLPVRAGEPGA